MADTNYPINHHILAEDFRVNSEGGEPYTQDDAKWLHESLTKMCEAYDKLVEEKESFKDAHGTTYTPMINDGRVGYIIDRPNAGVTMLYFNPSSDSDDGMSNVFVYMGDNGDPAYDMPLHFYDVGVETPDAVD